MYLTIIGDDDDGDDDPPFSFILSPINQTAFVRIPKSQMPPLDREDRDDVEGVANDVHDNFRAANAPWGLRSGLRGRGVPLDLNFVF